MNLTMAYSYHPGGLHHFMTTLRNEFTIVRYSAQCQVGHGPVVSEPIRDVIGKYNRRLNFHIQTDECWIMMLHRDIHSCLECWNSPTFSSTKSLRTLVRVRWSSSQAPSVCELRDVFRPWGVRHPERVLNPPNLLQERPYIDFAAHFGDIIK